MHSPLGALGDRRLQRGILLKSQGENPEVALDNRRLATLGILLHFIPGEVWKALPGMRKTKPSSFRHAKPLLQQKQ